MSDFLKKPWQLVVGTPAERAARGIISQPLPTATSSGHRSRSEQSRKEAGVLARKLKRRQVVLGGLGTLGLIATGGIAQQEGLFSSDPEYTGPIPGVEGKLLSDDEVTHITDALFSFGHPWLSKAASDVIRLRQPETPFELPAWLVHEDSTPLPIVENNKTRDSFATGYADSDPDAPHYLASGPGLTQEFSLREPKHILIQLGTQALTPDDSTSRGMFLAKEVFSHEVILQTQIEAEHTIPLFAGITISEMDGRHISDQTTRQRGYGAIMDDVRNQNVHILKTLDCFPIMMLHTIMQDLVAQGRVGKDRMSFVGLDILTELYEDPNLLPAKEQVKYIMDNWHGMLPDITHTGFFLSDYLFADRNPITQVSERFFDEYQRRVDPNAYTQY